MYGEISFDRKVGREGSSDANTDIGGGYL